MSVTLTFDPGGSNELILDESQIIRLNPAWTHTGKADLRAEVEITRSLDDYAQRQDRLDVSIDSTVEWTGFVTGTPHNERRGTTTLRAEGIEKKLEETRPDYDTIGGPVTYSQIALHDAIRDYWGRTPFSSYNVTDQTTTLIEDDTQIQSADTTTEWGNVTSISDTEPLVVQSGNLELAQSAFFFEGETLTLSGDVSDSNASDGSAENILTTVSDSTGSLEVDYTIPASDVGIAVRWRVEDSDTDGTATYPALELSVDSETVFDTSTVNTNTFDYTWEGGVGKSTDLTPGTYNITVDITSYGGDPTKLDCVVLYDDRHHSRGGFDNSVDTDGYLSSPKLYPDQYATELDSVSTSYNITQANISSTWNDTSNNQEIAVSNDGGSTYTSASNTTSLTANFSDVSRTVNSKLTLSRYGTRSTATPTSGFNGQNIQDYTLTVDLSDLVVIESLELTRNHWDNLQTLHNYGDFNWVIEHSSNDISNIVVESFQEGQVTRTSPTEWDNPNNKQPEVNAENYFNSVYLEGALDDTGNRPTAETNDSTAISNDNREIQVFLRDLTITTDAGAAFRANSLLETATNENDLEGRIVSPPNFVHPGYAYSVDFGEGANDKTLETVNWSYNNNENRMTYEFTVDEGFAEDVNQLKRQARELENQV